MSVQNLLLMVGRARRWRTIFVVEQVYHRWGGADPAGPVGDAILATGA